MKYGQKVKNEGEIFQYMQLLSDYDLFIHARTRNGPSMRFLHGAGPFTTPKREWCYGKSHQYDFPSTLAFLKSLFPQHLVGGYARDKTPPLVRAGKLTNDNLGKLVNMHKTKLTISLCKIISSYTTKERHVPLSREHPCLKMSIFQCFTKDICKREE